MAKFKFGGWKKSYTNISPDFASVKKMGAGNNAPDEHYLKEYTPISYQSFSDCVANATMDSLEILIGLRDPSKVVQLSRLFAYYNARAWDHATDQDAGCYIHNAFAANKLLGCCPEDEWTYTQSHLFTKPSLQAYSTANSNMVENYYEITSNGNQRIQDIIIALSNNLPVVFGTMVNSDLMGYGGEDKVFFPNAGSPEGGHAMCLTGYRTVNGRKQFLVRNSWGSAYGIASPLSPELGNGHFWMSPEYLVSGDTSDIFVPTLMPDLLVR